MVDAGGFAAGAMLLLLIASIAAVFAAWPALAALAAPPTKSRTPSLDGLRGVLALSVVVHHCIIASTAASRGWTEPSTALSNQLGSAAVVLFFIASGYLFCGALIRNGGHVDLARLAEGRFFRIYPAYIVGVVLMLICVGVMTGWRFNEPPQRVAIETAHWFLFPFASLVSINGWEEMAPLYSQIWSLRYEWCFYGLLPVMGLVSKATRPATAAAIVLVPCMLIDPRYTAFVAGLVVAVLAPRDLGRLEAYLPVAGVVALVAVLLGMHDSAGYLAPAVLAVTFLAALRGRGAFAVLARPELRFLGEISYSLYLLHSFVLYAISHWTGLGLLSGTPALVMFVLTTGPVSIVLAACSFYLIERPTMTMRPLTGRRRQHRPLRMAYPLRLARRAPDHEAAGGARPRLGTFAGG